MKENIQLTHADYKPSDKKFPFCIIADNISNPTNIGSLFRLCDAMGINKLYLCGDIATPPHSKINKTSRSTEKHVDFEYCSSARELVSQLKSAGHLIISLEITSSSIAINSNQFRKALATNKPVCLILGSENSGVNENLLHASDITIHIPMYGNNSSMNVISAASIACFEITHALS